MMTDKTAFHLQTALASGAFAAFFAALLWHSLLRVPLLPVLFGIGVSLPLYYAQFSAGLRSAALAAAAAAVLLCFALPLNIALAIAAFFFLPALLAGWLLNLRIAPQQSSPRAEMHAESLRQNSHSGKPAFYPLSAALFQLALAVAFVTVGALFYIFSEPAATEAFDALAAQIIQFAQQNNLYDLPAQAGGDLRLSLRRLLPALFAASLALYGFLFQLAALYGGLRLSARKMLLKRPLPYWPAELRMPPLALALCLALWALSYFVSNDAMPTLALCLNVILSVLAAGFCAAGLAVLHQAARGGWLWLRVLVYICLFSVVLTPVIFFGLVIMGLFATLLSLRRQNGGRPSV